MDPVFQDFFERLKTLHASVEHALDGLPSAALDWAPGPEMNSLAVLVTHLAGAERYWIGDVAGQAPSGRDRASEFLVHGLDRAHLLAQMASTLEHSRGVLEQLSIQDLEAERLSARDGEVHRVAWALAHALEHTALHTGHIQIGRQLLDEHREAWVVYGTPDAS
jgi:hypothetical protein